MIILSLNCRAISVGYHLYDWKRKKVLARGAVDRVVVGDSSLTLEVPGRETLRRRTECPTHRHALEVILEVLSAPGPGVLPGASSISAVAHRVAHGGERFTRSVRIDEQVVSVLRAVAHLAPLHNEPNIAGIEASLDLLPGIPQGAVFDTAFHQTMPPRAYIYPLPYEWYRRYGVRRYGFHGASHQFMAARGAALLGKEPTDCSLVTLELGNGVSVCAVKNGASVDTSMGFTPLEGALMGTRSGDIDPGIPAFLMNQEHLSPREMNAILNLKSGLLGVTGRLSERDAVRRQAAVGDERCCLALEMEAYRLRKYVGAYLAVLGGADAVVFSGGAGEAESYLREGILSGMECLGLYLDPVRNRIPAPVREEVCITRDESLLQAFVVPTDEDLIFAREVAALLMEEAAGPGPDCLSPSPSVRTAHR
jgi:acetate kinase